VSLNQGLDQSQTTTALLQFHKGVPALWGRFSPFVPGKCSIPEQPTTCFSEHDPQQSCPACSWR